MGKGIGQKGKLLDLTGMKFFKLTVIERAPNFRNATRWNCLCECGKEHTTYSSHLVQGRVKSCGCWVKSRGIRPEHIPNLQGENNGFWKGIGRISKTTFNNIKRNHEHSKRVSRQGLEFGVSHQYVAELFEIQNGKCALSGIELNPYTNEKDISLDRIDSTKGYIEGNVQWVHKNVNIMKNKFDQNYFIDMCGKIYNNKENI